MDDRQQPKGDERKQKKMMKGTGQVVCEGEMEADGERTLACAETGKQLICVEEGDIESPIENGSC